MLVDNFDRVINYIRVSVTDRCNLRCRYCVDGRFHFIPHPEVLSYEESIRFIKICSELGIDKVRLTGGEPLARKGITHLVREIGKIDAIKDISLTTNGVFLNDTVIELKEAGLKRVNISLDSLKRERFAYITGFDLFDKVISGIEGCIQAGISPIKINTVIIRGFNDDEVLDFARLANEKGLHVRFIEFMPFGEHGLWDSSKVVSSSEIESLIKTSYTLEPSSNYGGGPAQMFKIRGGNGQVGFISPVSTHLCSRCNRIRLTADGMLRPCLFSNTEYNVKALLRGNCSDDEIKAFVEGVVRQKPEKRNEMGQIKKCQLTLREIGG